VTVAAAGVLAGELERLLVELGPTSCLELARRLRRRKADVLAALQSDARFIREGGNGRGACWRLGGPVVPAGSREHFGGPCSVGSCSDAVRTPLIPENAGEHLFSPADRGPQREP
jgi:hypothetical protein